ncbi:TPA: hypothetical protein ACWSBY_004918, partial [Escherichia coli]
MPSGAWLCQTRNHSRRIINVSDGINNTDAATVGQLNERFDDAQVFLLQTNERIDETDKRLSTV